MPIHDPSLAYLIRRSETSRLFLAPSGTIFPSRRCVFILALASLLLYAFYVSSHLPFLPILNIDTSPSKFCSFTLATTQGESSERSTTEVLLFSPDLVTATSFNEANVSTPLPSPSSHSEILSLKRALRYNLGEYEFIGLFEDRTRTAATFGEDPILRRPS
ncbi:uncharacterized protein FOMMEDRAFT_165299 [Fomitiporia mediterranea MF3/22]|uniref:uncharacterized protein n=1 Tax=Fomitiporia mediterranea (strain MF3/22) TaxID=694068 RepID=UPI0004407F49|nr:uncharacterized protein FOMMEDRAFT_165299 [Fomitiporia mediterranea MF3/22]EJD06522.1 hypothetical protein FOMMEDRAFT_165299 [Fomitiporia mediterranea MF3/22]